MKKLFLIFLFIIMLIFGAWVIYMLSKPKITPNYKVISNNGGIQKGVFPNNYNFTYLDNTNTIHRFNYQNNSLVNLGNYKSKTNISNDGNFTAEIDENNLKTKIYKLDDKKLVKKIDGLVFAWQNNSDYTFVKLPEDLSLQGEEIEDFTTKGPLIYGNAENKIENIFSTITASNIFSLSNSNYAIYALDIAANEMGHLYALNKYNLQTKEQSQIIEKINIYQSRYIEKFIIFKEGPNESTSIKYINKNGEIKSTNLTARLDLVGAFDENNLIAITQEKRKNLIILYELESHKTTKLFEISEDIKDPVSLYYNNNKIIITNNSGIWLLEFEKPLK